MELRPDHPWVVAQLDDLHEIAELVKALQRDHGITVMMVEHHIEVVLGLAERIAVMHHGQLIACDAPESIMADPLVQSAYLGEAL